MIIQYFRKLGKIGRAKSGSYYVTIPKQLVQDLGWIDDCSIIIRRAGKQRRLTLEAHEPWRSGLIGKEDVSHTKRPTLRRRLTD